MVDKAREIIHVAISVIALDAIPKPKDFANPKEISQPLFDLGLREVGISIWIQQARFRREKGARSVDVDGATFEDHPGFVHGKIEFPRNPRGHDVVVVEWRVFPAP